MVGNFDSDIYGGAEKGGDGYATELVDEGDTAADVPEATAETRRRRPSAETSYFFWPDHERGRGPFAAHCQHARGQRALAAAILVITNI